MDGWLDGCICMLHDEFVLDVHTHTHTSIREHPMFMITAIIHTVVNWIIHFPFMVVPYPKPSANVITPCRSQVRIFTELYLQSGQDRATNQTLEALISHGSWSLGLDISLTISELLII